MAAVAKKALERRPERWIGKTLLIACVLLSLGFAGAWFYMQYEEQQRLSSSYTSLKPLAISRGGHSIGASFAVQTSNADARWALQNRLALESALQQALLQVDPKRVLAPNGLLELQRRLSGEVNATLGSDKVQEIVITDFLVSEGDY